MTDKATLATRWHFVTLCQRCIEDARSGAIRVNRLSEYIDWQQERIESLIAGKDDHTFTFRQQRHYMMTGECVALLPR
jgi:hypothetical protein